MKHDRTPGWEGIDFCYRPQSPKLSVKRRKRRPWPKGIASLVTVGVVGTAVAGLVLFAPTRSLICRLMNSVFSVRQVVIEAPHDLDSMEAASSCLDKLGRSLLDISQREMRKAIAEIPSVKSVKVRKVYPSTLVVDIQVRRPMFVVELGGELLGLSADGVLLPVPREARELPTLTGLRFTKASPGGRITADYFSRLVSFCESLSAAGQLGPGSRIKVVDQMEVYIFGATGGPGLIFSLDEFDRQIGKFSRANGFLGSRKEECSFVDLRFKGQIVLRKSS